MTVTAAGPPDPSTARKVAKALGDRYKIISKLGMGAFSDVYKARDTILNRTVAIKRIRLDACDDLAELDELMSRFLREAQVAAQLQHPNIVTIYDILTTEGMTFIVMELVDGVTLKWELALKERLSLSDAIDVLSPVAEALDYAHQQKVVHRDVKPANIMIAASGKVKVTDFGIAKAESSSNLTAAGTIVGTPDYMSPEQAQGRDVDGRSDVFSLGCVLYECLSGNRPFRSNNLTGVLLEIVNHEPHPVDWENAGLPSAIQAIVRRALVKKPSQRFASPVELVDALRSLPLVDHTAGNFAGGASKEPRFEKTLVEPAPPPEAGMECSVDEGAGVVSDSVADALMKEARNTAEIDRHLRALQKEKRRLRAVSSPLLNFRNVTLTTEEAFLLSRMDGRHSLEDILAVSPLSEEQTARTLLGLLRAGILELEGEPIPPKSTEMPESAEEQGPGARASSGEGQEQEMEKLFELSQQQDHWQVLGLERGAGIEEIARAFQEKASHCDPDRYRQIGDPSFHQKLSHFLSRLAQAFAVSSKEAQAHRDRKLAESAPPRRESASRRAEAEELPSGNKKHPVARDLFRRAKQAFEKKDYWGTIEHCRSAIEFAGDQAEYFHLLGLALAQNREWREEAEENLKIAADLDPSKAEYFGALGELYQDEGQDSQARVMFEKAKGIEPTYELPEKQGEEGNMA